jgi:hypothetical protein
MKNPRSWHRADQAEWNKIVARTPKSGRWRRISRFSDRVWRFAKESAKRSTIWLKKVGLVYDLLEKI